MLFCDVAPGHWAVLNLIEGSLRFVNLETNEERVISAPELVTIHPGLTHRVALEGPLSCQIDLIPGAAGLIIEPTSSFTQQS